MRHLHAFISVFLLLTAAAAAGSFTAQIDVDTYVDANNSSQGFADSDLLWAASSGGESSREVYLGIINVFGSQGIFDKDRIASATLTLDAAQVENAGNIKAYFLHGETLDTTTWSDKVDYDASVSSAPLEITGEKSYRIDVTDIVKKAVDTCTEGCPYSIVLVAEDDASVAFFSSESSQGEEPTLVYTTSE